MRRSKKKKPEATSTEETIRELFPEAAIEKAKEVAAESGRRVESSSKKGKSEETPKQS
jgi:hypothetical protein